jgi:hypothetical protein
VAIEGISALDLQYVQIVSGTPGQKAARLRLAANGIFAVAFPLTESANQIEVLTRFRQRDNAHHVKVYYHRTTQRSLDFELVLENEKKLPVQIERVGTSPKEIQMEAEHLRRKSSVWNILRRRWRRIHCSHETRKRRGLERKHYFLTLSTSAAIAISDAPARLILDITRTVSPNNTSLSPLRITIFSALAASASLRAGSRVSSVTFF